MMYSTFVGRDGELAELRAFFDKAHAGNGQVCFITGQAGSGKSALVRRFVQQMLAEHPDVVVAIGACNSQSGVGDPYLPFREALAMLTGDVATGQAVLEDAPEIKHRVRAILVRSVEVLVDVAPELVGVFVPGVKLLGHVGKAVVTRAGWTEKLEQLTKKEALAAGSIEPPAEQNRIFEQYTAFVQRMSEEAPLILFFDDLQWADNASLNLFFHLARRIEMSRVLLLGAYRPTDVALGRETGARWTRHALEPIVFELTRYFGDITIDLDQIPQYVNRQFVDALIDLEPNRLDQYFRNALFRQTGGHALFTVELLRALQENGGLIQDSNGRWVESPSLDWGLLPARVEGVIGERIARLDEELREILTVGSVEGEEFTAEVVAHVEQLAERDVIRHCDSKLQRQHQLIHGQGLVQRGRLRVSLYRFTHNLFQQYLYSNLGEAERIYLHRDVGAALETLFAQQTDDVAAQLAHHFEVAGIASKTIAFRLQAGLRARRMSANHEAVNHFTRGLQLLSDLPSGPERIQAELGLQTALGATLILTQGYASPPVQAAYGRARQLCRELGDPPEAIPVLYGLCAYGFVRGDLQKTYEEAEQLYKLTQQVGDGAYALGAQQVMGTAAMHLGRFEQARQQLEAVIAQYDPVRHRDLAYAQGHDPAVGALSFLAFVLWQLGYPDQALAKMNEALALAHAVDHPYTLGFATSFSSMLYQMLRRWPECQAQAEQARALGERGGFPLWQAIGALSRGLALVHQGETRLGLADLELGIATWQASGARLSLPYQYSLLAEAHLVAGQPAEGLKALDSTPCCNEEIWWRPEAQRIRGELLLLTPGGETEAEATLRDALVMAQDQQAKALELRAVMSLARLLDRQGRTAEGYTLLSACYQRFDEGFATADLVDAAALLAGLAPASDTAHPAPAKQQAPSKAGAEKPLVKMPIFHPPQTTPMATGLTRVH
jgi:predicted ATPase/exonuclease VII small subunit